MVKDLTKVKSESEQLFPPKAYFTNPAGKYLTEKSKPLGLLFSAKELHNGA